MVNGENLLFINIVNFEQIISSVIWDTNYFVCFFNCKFLISISWIIFWKKVWKSWSNLGILLTQIWSLNSFLEDLLKNQSFKDKQGRPSKTHNIPIGETSLFCEVGEGEGEEGNRFFNTHGRKGASRNNYALLNLD